jgi:hypothetical protein
MLKHVFPWCRGRLAGYGRPLEVGARGCEVRMGNSMATPDEVRSIIRVIQTDPSVREELRRALLTDELLALPQRFAEFVEAADRRFRAIEADLETLKQDVSVLKQDMAKVKGGQLELAVRLGPERHLFVVVKRAKVVALDALLSELGIEDALSEEEYDLLAAADAFVRGASRRDGREVVLVVEATWKPHSRDLRREVERRDVLARHGVEATAVVVSVDPPSPSVRRAAEEAGVVLLQREPELSAA